MSIWLQFIGCVIVILVTGTNLSRYGDVIAEKTGLGRTFIGLVLLASATSLAELVTGISSVAYFDLPDIAAGDVLGSCMFNVLILAVLDVANRSTPISARAHSGHVASAALGALLLGLVGISLVVGHEMPALGWFGASSLVFVIVYLMSMNLVYRFEKRRLAEVPQEESPILYANVTARRAIVLFAANAVVIVAAAAYMPHLADRIAEMTGLGRTFVGSLFVALSTSLPEVAVSIAAMRLGAVDMVYGNIFGSNLFNIAILAVDDALYTKGPLLAYVSGNHLISVLAAMSMTAVAVVGLAYRATRKPLFLAWDAIGIAGMYVLATLVLYARR